LFEVLALMMCQHMPGAGAAKIMLPESLGKKRRTPINWDGFSKTRKARPIFFSERPYGPK